MSLIYAFAQMRHFYELPFFDKGDDLVFHSSQTWIKSATALSNLLSSAYWDRAWVLQEIVLAQEPIMHYGQHIMPFDVLTQAQKYFEVHYQFCCAAWGSQAHRKEFSHWTEILAGFGKFRTLENLRKVHALPKNGRSVHSSLSISDIMISGVGKRKASDPRDLVYGILGLVESDETIDADYTIDVARVYARTAFHIISEQQSLLILGFNDLGRDEELGLPSWAPDWTSNGYFCPQPYNDSMFAASKGRKFYAKLENALHLRIRTVQIDLVTETSAMRAVSWAHPKELVKQIRDWRQEAGLPNPSPLPQSKKDGEDAFWRSVFADTMKEYDEGSSIGEIRKFQNRDLDKVLSWWEWLQAESQIFVGTEWHSLRTRQHAEGFHFITDTFWKSTETRKLFLTAAGQIETGPAAFGSVVFGDVAANDEIHIAFGSNLPIIVRPLPATLPVVDKSQKKIQFVGVCYVHGVMDGEALGDEDLEGDDILLC